MTLFSISAKEIENLDAAKFTDVMNRLLKIEASGHKIPLADIHTTERINDPDGGIDAKIIKTPSNITSNWLPSGESIWQFKSGNISPSEIKTEIEKQGVRKAINNGAYYCLAVNSDYTEKTRTTREQGIKDRITNAKYKFYTASDISSWISQHPTIALLPHFNHPIGELMTLEKWASNPLHQSVNFFCDTTRQQYIDTIREQLKKDTGAIHIRVEGLPGVGKTRLVLESLKDDSLANLVLYARSIDDIPLGLFKWFETNTQNKAILVIDDISAEEAQKKAELANTSNGRLRIITIGHPIAFRMSDIREILTLETLPTAQMQELIKTIEKSFTTSIVNFIAEMSGGYVKLAMAIIGAIKKFPDMVVSTADLIKHRNIKELLMKLIPDEKEFNALKSVSILTRVGWDGDLSVEGKTLAEFMAISWPDICQSINHLYKRGLIVKQGRYRYVTPHLLSIWLAAEVWDERGEQEMIALLEKLHYVEGKKNLIRRLATLGDHEQAQKVVTKLLSQEGFFPDFNSINDELKAEIFSTLAEANPQAGLQTLERLLGSLTPEQLRNIDHGRRYIIFTLEKLVWLPETFNGSARLLLALAEAENENWGNNATGIWISLFLTFLGGTAVPAMERLDLIEEILKSPAEQRRILAVKALDAAFRTHETGWTTGEHLSSRIAPRRWQPKTHKEVREIRIKAFELLKTAFADVSEKVKIEAFNTLNCRSMLLLGLGNELCDFIEPLSLTDEQKASLRHGIESSIHYDSKNLPEELIERLKKLAGKLTGISSADRLKRWVGHRSTIDWNKETHFKKADENIIALAVEAFKNPELFTANLEWLSSREAENVWIFGRHFGNLDKNKYWLDSLVNVAKTNKGLTLVASYMHGRIDDGELIWWEDTLDAWTNSEPSLANAVFECTWRGPTTTRGVQRLCKLVENGLLKHEILGTLVIGAWPTKLSIQDFRLLLETSLSGGEKEIGVTIDILDQWLREHPDETTKLEALALQSLKMGVMLGGNAEWHWGQIADRYIKEHAIEIVKIILPAFENEHSLYLSNDRRMQILGEAAKIKPVEIWGIISEQLTKENIASFRLHLSIDKWFIDNIPTDIIIDWINKNSTNGPRIVSSICPVGGIPIHPLAHFLLSNYGDNKHIQSDLYGSFTTGSWSGPESSWLEGKINIAQEWSKDTNKNVHQWAEKIVQSLKKRMEKSLTEEAESGF